MAYRSPLPSGRCARGCGWARRETEDGSAYGGASRGALYGVAARSIQKEQLAAVVDLGPTSGLSPIMNISDSDEYE